jgi:tyrosinase
MFPFRKVIAACLLIFVSVSNSSRCSNPSVRREWSAISETERVEWIDAVKCLATLPHSDALTPTVDPALSLIPAVNTSSSYYDDIVYVHMDLNIEIHFTGQFLPWHRAYVLGFESALKTKCGYNGTQPYWNWSLNTENFFNSSIFDPSPTSGFGGDGDPNNDYQISDGGFSNEHRAYPVPNKIRRNFTLQAWKGLLSPFADQVPDPTLDPNKYANTTFDEEEVSKLVNGFEGDFRGFQVYFEAFQGAHAGVHSIIAADMFGTCPSNAGPTCVPGAKWTPNDPIFFMHHAMVDKVWYDWQHEHEANFWSFQGGSVEALENATFFYANPNGAAPWLNFNSTVPMDGLFEEYTIFDLMDTTSDTLCYIYA